MKPLIRKRKGLWQVANFMGNSANPAFLNALRWCIARNGVNALHSLPSSNSHCLQMW